LVGTVPVFQKTAFLLKRHLRPRGLFEHEGIIRRCKERKAINESETISRAEFRSAEKNGVGTA